MPVTPGAPVTVTVAGTAYPIFNGHKLVKRLFIQPFYQNGGVGFVGDSTLAPNAATPTGIMQQLPTPSPSQIPTFDVSETEAPNGLDLGNFYVSSTQANDIFIFSYDEQ
jgi:hypothetical protein